MARTKWDFGTARLVDGVWCVVVHGGEFDGKTIPIDMASSGVRLYVGANLAFTVFVKPDRRGGLMATNAVDAATECRM